MALTAPKTEHQCSLVLAVWAEVALQLAASEWVVVSSTASSRCKCMERGHQQVLKALRLRLAHIGASAGL